jgi:hypothetical protein
MLKLQEPHHRKPSPPVPYRIAKALDPSIYRNVELDIWEEERRGISIWVYKCNGPQDFLSNDHMESHQTLNKCVFS